MTLVSVETDGQGLNSTIYRDKEVKNEEMVLGKMVHKVNAV